MDTVIPRKSKKIRFLAIGAAVILLLGALTWMAFSRKRELDVVASEVLIKTASVEPFEDFTVFNARVEPLQTMLVNVLESGSVQQIFAENGSVVEKGQPLVKLYNPNSELSYMNQETAVIEQMNNLNNGKLNIRNQELSLTKDVSSIEHDYNEAKRLYDLNSVLFDKGVISRNDWNITKEAYRYQSERRNQILEGIKREKASNRIQIAQINRSLATMEKSLAIIRANKNNLLVLSPVSGTLTSFEPVLGKQYGGGEPLGKIDLKKGYKLTAEVDEFYLDKIAEGQKGHVDVAGKDVTVVVTKRVPEVKGGRFTVELAFVGVQPQVQQGTNFGVRLTLSASRRSLVVPKGSFFSDTAGKWIFVVNGATAQRRSIRVGRDNPDYYEITEGLKPGDRVITSSYRDFTEADILNLQ